MAAAPIVTKGVRGRFESVLNKVLSAWTKSDGGALSSSDFGISFYEDALSQLLVRDGSDLSELEFKQCVTGAARDLVKLGQTGSDSFNVACAKRREDILAQGVHLYFGLSRCAFHVHGKHWVPFTFFGKRACICTDPPADFDLSEFFISGHGCVDPQKPTNGLYIIIGPVSSRSKSGALDIIGDDLTAILGFIAFWIDCGRLSRRIGRVGPTTDIQAGDSIILFSESLSRADDQVSYFIQPPAESKSLTSNAESNLFAACVAATKLERLHKSKEQYLLTAFRLYHNAVSVADPDDQITKLWKLAEFLTFSAGGNVDRLARRLSLTWEDSDLIYAIAFAAGQRRNIITHQSGDGVSSTQIVEYFKYVIGIFMSAILSEKVTSMKSWYSVLEVGSSGFDLGLIETSIGILRGFTTAHGAPDDEGS